MIVPQIGRIQIVIPDGRGRQVPVALTVSIPWATDTTWLFAVVHSDGSPYNLTACTVLFTIKAHDTDVAPLVGRAADVTDVANGLCQVKTKSSDDRSLLVPGSYVMDVIFEDSSGIELVRDEGLFPSRLEIRRTIQSPGDPVTVPSSSPPLALGPPGYLLQKNIFAGGGNKGDTIVFDSLLTETAGSAAYRALKNGGFVPDTQAIVGWLQADCANGAIGTIITYGAISPSISGLLPGAGPLLTISFTAGPTLGRIVTAGVTDTRYGYCDGNGNAHMLAAGFIG